MPGKALELNERLLEYISGVAFRETELMSRLRAETATMRWAVMQIPPEQGAFLAMLVGLLGARRCLELGSFTGYSALAVAQALPADGQIICCDVSDEWTSIARRYWVEAGVSSKIDLRLAPAAETLGALLASGEAGTFDFAFIDADKEGYDSYYEQCLQLVRPGGLIALDNMLMFGTVADPEKTGEAVAAVRALNAKIRDDARVEMCLLPFADGLTLCRRVG